jgi:formylglycine-generating enzyme required for sulfatase activity
MKTTSCFSIIAAAALVGLSAAAAQLPGSGFVSESEREFVANGDFDGDGRADVVIVDRDSGRVRIGYQMTTGTFTWANWKASNVKDVSAIAIGRLFDPKRDGLAVVAADGNQFNLVDPGRPDQIPVPVAMTLPGLGPNSVAAVDIGGAGNTPLHDLYLNTMYNSPTPNQVTLFRNEAGNPSKLADLSMTATVTHANRVALKAGQPELLCLILTGEESDTFRVEDLSSGKPQTVGTIAGLPSGADYIVGNFRGSSLRDVVFFKPGEKALHVRPVQEPSPGQFEFGGGASFELDQPIKNLFAIWQGSSERLVTLFGTGETGGVFNFDGAKAPSLVQSLAPAADELLSAVASLDDGFLLLSAPSQGKIKYSTHYYRYQFAGTTNALLVHGNLASLADNDDATVPDVHKMILANLKERTEADMKRYTNTIPGTDAKYVMVPILGGEFLMGSAAAEKGCKPDETPQHKVKIEPFWMGAFEVTWNEYELFMYPDEERKFQDKLKTDPYVDKVSDAVTRPSKPYVEMSFGMGKDGYPAIAMTHHAANKYCHWLSAKTGHFYRLPTEAEWEYACRAGTTTAYSFGDNPAPLKEYAWYERNSDFKYQKVGRKKPNPWGLYDIHGNVVEWCLDQYAENYYAACTGSIALEPWNRATQPYPHAVRGGSWDDPADALRSAARRGSSRDWKAQDPQLPKSVWWLSDAQWVGFRLVRPLKVPPPEELLKCWTSGTEKD